MSTTPLPPLPKATVRTDWHTDGCGFPAYTHDQMQAYAQAARADLEAENQRLREALEELLRHFTRSPSSLADSETRIKAHAALESKP